MPYNYSPLVDVATELIDEFGQDATLIQSRKTGGARHNPTYEDTETTVRVVDINQEIVPTDGGGALLSRQERVLYLSGGASVVPTEFDKIRVGGRLLQITDVMPTQPGGVTVYYELKVRG